MKSTRIELHRSARNFLQGEIDLLKPGEALPGIRTLCSRSNIKFHILNSELQLMIRDGKVAAVPRRGIFKCAEPEKKTIWLFHEQELQNISGFTLEIYEQMRTVCKKHGFNVKTCLINETFLSRCRDFCRKHRVNIAFCKGFSHPLFMDMISRECSHCISLLPSYTVNDGFALIDSPEMSKIQLKYLFNLGYRKIGYIHNVDKPAEKSIIQQTRLLEYYRIMAEHGLQVKPEWVFSGYCRPDIFADRLNLLMKNGAEAVIVAGSFVRILYETLHNQLYVPGRDLGIFCCDKINGLPEPVPATVTNSPKEIVESAWQLLQESISGAAPRIEQSQLRIITGNTLSRCGSSTDKER